MPHPTVPPAFPRFMVSGVLSRNPWGGGSEPPGKTRPPSQPSGGGDDSHEDSHEDPRGNHKDHAKRFKPASIFSHPKFGGGGRGGGGGGSLPFNFDSLNPRMIFLAGAALLFLWLLSGFYVVNNEEEGIVLFLGKYDRTEPPGIHYHLPWPLETVTKLAVTRVHRLDIGVSSLKRDGRGRGLSATANDETLMLTGDENIVEASFSVFWLINNGRDFLFKVKDPEQTIRAAAESVIREVIGQTPISIILTEGRGKIEQDIRSKLQALMNAYAVGVQITQVQLQSANPPEQVIAAYRDVQAAKADQERLKNEAETYRNKVVPEARGEAAKIEQEAIAHRERVTAKAQGEAERFNLLLEAYSKNPDLFKRRLHVETLEHILKGKQKIVIDGAVVGKNGSMVPYLPLDKLTRTSP